MKTTVQADRVTVTIIANDRGNPVGKLADAELHFADGPLAGLKLIGFAIWERRGAGGRNVTFPARQYSVNGERIVGEVELGVGELSGGVALVVGGDLDGDAVGLDGGLHGAAPPGSRDWFLREKSGTITRPGEDRSGARGARGHRRPHPACPGSLARRLAACWVQPVADDGRLVRRGPRPPDRRRPHVETA